MNHLWSSAWSYRAAGIRKLPNSRPGSGKHRIDLLPHNIGKSIERKNLLKTSSNIFIQMCSFKNGIESLNSPLNFVWKGEDCRSQKSARLAPSIKTCCRRQGNAGSILITWCTQICSKISFLQMAAPQSGSGFSVGYPLLAQLPKQRKTGSRCTELAKPTLASQDVRKRHLRIRILPRSIKFYKDLLSSCDSFYSLKFQKVPLGFMEYVIIWKWRDFGGFPFRMPTRVGPSET